jgi:hypothetical protein
LSPGKLGPVQPLSDAHHLDERRLWRRMNDIARAIEP